MKKLILIFSFLSISNFVLGQTYSETASEFIEAVKSKNNIKVIEKGEWLIGYIESQNTKIDSLDFPIYTLTARAYINLGNYKKGLEINLKLEKKTGENNFSTNSVNVLNSIANCYSKIENYSKSIEYYLRALNIYEKTSGKESSDYAFGLNNLALSYTRLGDYSKSLEYNIQALNIREKKFGKEHIEYATSLNNIAINYSNLGDYSKSLKYNLEALNIYEKKLEKKNPALGTIIINLAELYSKLGDYRKSLEYNLAALEIYEKIDDKAQPVYAICINNLALNYSNLGQYSKSLDYNLKSLKIKEKIYGKLHSDYALGLNNLAYCYSDLGDYSKSLVNNLAALNIYEKTLGKEHPRYATSLNNVASCYSDLGEYTESLKYNLEALKITEKNLGKEHPDYARSLSNLAVCYSDLGDYSKSLEYNLESLKILEKTIGKEHPDYATSLNNLAMDYSCLRDFLKSLYYNLEALKIKEKTLGKGHYDYAISLNNIADNYSDLKDYSKSLEYNKESLKIREKSLGKTHPSYATSLSNLAKVYSDLKDYSKAFEYNLEALKITEKTLGKEHPSYALSASNLSVNYSDLKDYESAFKYALESAAIRKSLFNKNKFGLDEKNRITYKKDLESSFNLLANTFIYNKKDNDKLYDVWCSLNGIVNSDIRAVQERIFKSKDTSLTNLGERLKLSKLQLHVFNEMTIEERNKKGIDVEGLEKQIEVYEMELSRKSKDFAELQRNITRNDIRKNLRGSEVLVEIVPFPVYSYSSHTYVDSSKYMVFMMDGKDTLVDHFIIDDGNELEEDVFLNYRKQAMSVNGKTDLKNTNFYNTFWKPISEKIGDAKTVYVSLGGVYNNINLNTLYNSETGKYLLEERDIRIVNSSRDFVLAKEREKTIYSNNTACLFGFPNYDGNNTTIADTLNYLATSRDLNSFWIDSLTRGGLKAKPLPETKTEVENISKTLKKKGWNTTTYLADDASETEIKKQTSPRILHIATHGYFFKDVPMEKNEERFMGMDKKKVIQNPMLRSGLLFTGANKTLKGEEVKGENGLLSAAEASLLDLRGTELVVLSACETAKGEVKNSEGVYGLRKSFADAGARNIIMSLWKVDDKVTQEFMTRFYEVWLNEKMTIRQAFNTTQIEIKNKYPEPYYWGAFILVGE